MHLNSDHAEKEILAASVPAPAEVQGCGVGSAEGQTNAEENQKEVNAVYQFVSDLISVIRSVFPLGKVNSQPEPNGKSSRNPVSSVYMHEASRTCREDNQQAAFGESRLNSPGSVDAKIPDGSTERLRKPEINTDVLPSADLKNARMGMCSFINLLNSKSASEEEILVSFMSMYSSRADGEYYISKLL